jgi:hypothetical protein
MLCVEGTEEKVALLISETLKPFYKFRPLQKLAFDLATLFSVGHFLNIEVINIELERLLSSTDISA